MRAVLRGFLAGFGFALGASVAGTLIGYTIGKLGEKQFQHLFSGQPDNSYPPSSSSPESSAPPASDTTNGPSDPQPGVLTDEQMVERGWLPDGTIRLLNDQHKSHYVDDAERILRGGFNPHDEA